MWYGDGPWEHGFSWGIGGWVMGIGMIALVVAGVVLVVYLVRSLSASPHAVAGQAAACAVPAEPGRAATAPSADRAETPREIVQRRYASGEIDRDEYLQKLEDL